MSAHIGVDLNGLARSAQQHLTMGRPDLAKPMLDALLQAAPGDRIVKMLATQSAVISFPVPAQREPINIEQGRVVAQENIDLAAFHVDLPRAPSGIHGAIDYHEVLRLAFQTAATKAPRARRIILTDETTKFPADIGADVIMRWPVDHDRIMYERLRLQVEYLRTISPERASVLMDTDIVTNRDPCEVFAWNFDIALTWRTGFPDAPFNGGLIFVAPGNRGREFLARARGCYDRLAATPEIAQRYDRDLKAWWGDQFALALTAGYREFGERSTNGVAVDGVAVAYLPCERFNVTIEPNVNYGIEDLRRMHFVHFKGNRKGLLKDYAELIRSGKI